MPWHSGRITTRSSFLPRFLSIVTVGSWLNPFSRDHNSFLSSNILRPSLVKPPPKPVIPIPLHNLLDSFPTLQKHRWSSEVECLTTPLMEVFANLRGWPEHARALLEVHAKHPIHTSNTRPIVASFSFAMTLQVQGSAQW